MTIANILNAPGLEGMRQLRRWIVYSLVPDADRPGKTKKIPLHPVTGYTASVTDPNTWTDVQTAARSAQAWGCGLGFVFTADCGFWFLDLDACYDGSAWSGLARLMGQSLAGAAVEVSASGRGLHFFGRGTVPEHSKKNIEQHAELYTEGRFCAMTGTSLVGDCNTDHTAAMAWIVPTYFPPRQGGEPGEVAQEGPCPEWRGPTDDADLLRRALQSRSAASVFAGNRASFADLWHADVAALSAAYPPDAGGSEPYDRSSADAALAQHLAFWTGRDVARIERLMRQSALAREKWDQRDDYLVERTIRGACARQTQVLQDKPIEPVMGLASPGATPGPALTAAASVVRGPEANSSTVVKPAMRAVEGSTFLDAAAQQQLFNGCVYILDDHRVLVPGGLVLKPDQFKALYGGYTFAMDARNERTTRNAYEAFTESQVLRGAKANTTCFRPDLEPGAIITECGFTAANTWWPIETPCEPGDVEPFLNHVRLLFPNGEDGFCMICYMACLLQHPGIKFQCAPVIQGVEGNGKTFLSRCAAAAIGERYTYWPKAARLHGQFNGWVDGRLLFCVEDIHTNDQAEIIEILKPMITGDVIEVERKGIDQRTIRICGNFIFNTNHRNGIRKTRNDRRFIILMTAQQSVEDLARDGMDEAYHRRLYDWAKAGGYAAVTHYLRNLQIPDRYRFDLGIRAPRTTSTDAAINASLGSVEQEIAEAIEQDEVGFKGGWVSSLALNKLLAKLGKAGAVPLNRRRDLMTAMGYDWHPGLPEGRVNNPTLPDGGKPRLYIKQGHPALALTEPSAIVKAYRDAQTS